MKTVDIKKIKKDVKELRLVEKNMWTPFVLLILRSIPSDKYVSREFLMEIVREEVANHPRLIREASSMIMNTMSRLTREKLLENEDLMQPKYRGVKITDSSLISRLEMAKIISRKEAGEIHYSTDFEKKKRVDEIIKKLTPQQKTKVVYYSEGEAQENILKFTSESVLGSVKFIGQAPTWSVFRITEAGTKRADLYEKQLRRK